MGFVDGATLTRKIHAHSVGRVRGDNHRADGLQVLKHLVRRRDSTTISGQHGLSGGVPNAEIDTRSPGLDSPLIRSAGHYDVPRAGLRGPAESDPGGVGDCSSCLGHTSDGPNKEQVMAVAVARFRNSSVLRGQHSPPESRLACNEVGIPNCVLRCDRRLLVFLSHRRSRDYRFTPLHGSEYLLVAWNPVFFVVLCRRSCSPRLIPSRQFNDDRAAKRTFVLQPNNALDDRLR
jgi:hypothetical protein